MKRNFFPLIALLAGFGVVIYGIVGGGGVISAFIDFPSLFIVLGGSLGALAIVYPLSTIKKIPKLFGVVLSESATSLKALPDIFKQLSQKTKTQGGRGVLELESSLDEIDDEFFKRGIQMVMDGADADKIRTVLEADLDALEERHSTNQAMLAKWSTLAPGFGMIGTVIGLIVMLGDLGGGADELGAGMATALITTFYGSVFQNLIFDPLTENLKKKTGEEVFFRRVMIEGLVLLQGGVNPSVLKEQLVVYLSPSERAEVLSEERGE